MFNGGYSCQWCFSLLVTSGVIFILLCAISYCANLSHVWVLSIEVWWRAQYSQIIDAPFSTTLWCHAAVVTCAPLYFCAYFAVSSFQSFTCCYDRLLHFQGGQHQRFRSDFFQAHLWISMSVEIHTLWQWWCSLQLFLTPVSYSSLVAAIFALVMMPWVTSQSLDSWCAARSSCTLSVSHRVNVQTTCIHVPV